MLAQPNAAITTSAYSEPSSISDSNCIVGIAHTLRADPDIPVRSKSTRPSSTLTFNTKLSITDMAGTTSTTSAVHTYPRLHLLGLPQELQDMIFDHAYRRSSDTKLISREDFNGRNVRMQRRWGLGFFPRIYPGEKVSEFLVSKQYFLAATKAYLTTAPLDLTRREFTVGEPFWTTGAIAAFVKDVVGNGRTCDHADHLSSLKTLHLSVAVREIIQTSADKLLPMTVRSLSEDEIASTWVAKSLEYLKGLSMLTIVPEQHEEDDLNPVESAVFKSNLNMLCALLRPKVSEEKDQKSSQEEDILAEPDGFVPLYAGSKVSLHDSKIRQLVTRQELAEALKGMTDWLIDAGHAPKDVGAFVQCVLEKELERANNVGIESIKEHSLLRAAREGDESKEKLRIAEIRGREMAEKLRKTEEELWEFQRAERIGMLLLALAIFLIVIWKIFGDALFEYIRGWWITE